MSKHRPPMTLRDIDDAEHADGESLTSPLDTAQIRLKLVTVCYRPDKSESQIIAFAQALEKYVISGQP